MTSPEIRRNIVWLASYPKSGNTWLRLVLANYLTNATQPFPVNQLGRMGGGDAVAAQYSAVAGRGLDGLDEDAILALRPKVLRGYALNGADVNLLKTHNPNRHIRGVEMIPPSLSKAAIYIIRNPLDVVGSYKAHYGITIEQTVEAMGRDDHVVMGAGTAVTQFPGAWSSHVQSWTGAKAFPVTVLRYEDMQTDPVETFTKALTALGAPVDAARLERALEFSAFDQAREQEAAHGFIEKGQRASAPFFRSGASGGWKDTMPENLVQRIIADHGRVMRKFGYL